MEKKKVQILMPVDQWESLAAIANKMGVSVSALINIAVMEYLSSKLE